MSGARSAIRTDHIPDRMSISTKCLAAKPLPPVTTHLLSSPSAIPSFLLDLLTTWHSSEKSMWKIRSGCDREDEKMSKREREKENRPLRFSSLMVNCFLTSSRFPHPSLLFFLLHQSTASHAFLFQSSFYRYKSSHAALAPAPQSGLWALSGPVGWARPDMQAYGLDLGPHSRLIYNGSGPTWAT